MSEEVGSVAPVRVLVVDDQELFRRAASAVVRSMREFAIVGSAADGEESVDAAADVRPDLVLMDVNLPGIDGLEATRRIRRLDPAPVVVLLSTYELNEYADDALLCGASAYISKSDFDPGRLRQVWNAVRP